MAKYINQMPTLSNTIWEKDKSRNGFNHLSEQMKALKQLWLVIGSFHPRDKRGANASRSFTTSFRWWLTGVLFSMSPCLGTQVKKVVNWALHQIRKRNKALNKQAIPIAEEIAQLESKSARWIAADALRELKSDAVQKRLKN